MKTVYQTPAEMKAQIKAAWLKLQADVAKAPKTPGATPAQIADCIAALGLNK